MMTQPWQRQPPAAEIVATRSQSAPAARRILCAGAEESLATPALPSVGLTVYGCGEDEAALFRALAPRLGVRPTIFGEAASASNAQLVRGSQCVSVGHKSAVDRSTLRALSEAGVRYISTRSVGYDHIDVEYARSLAICVETVSYSPDSVADYTLMLMLMAIRHMRSVVQRVDAHDYRLNEVRGRELRDMTIGVVGTGRIGSAVIARLRGFGCRTLTYDLRSGSAAAPLTLDELLQRSDIVTLHTPLTPETHHLLDRRRIERLKPGAVVINTARGPLVDTDALVAALQSGRLGGAALDVLEGEEGIFYTDRRSHPVENPALLRLHELPNVLISPHTAYYTEHALRDTVENCLVNCVHFVRGQRCG